MILVRQIFKAFCFPALFFMSFVITGNAVANQSGPAFKFETVVIDAGHGGKDPGAHGAYSLEKNIALAIAKKVKEQINEKIPVLKVVMTRSTDKFIELKRRSEIANLNHANLFVSIHCNSTSEGTGKVSP